MTHLQKKFTCSGQLLSRKSIFKKRFPKAAVRSTAIFAPSPPGRGQLCMELTMKDDKIDLRKLLFVTVDGDKGS